MCRERLAENAHRVLGIHQTYRQVLIVKRLAGIYRNLLRKDSVFAVSVYYRVQHDVLSAAAQLLAIHTHFCSVGVAAAQQIVIELECHTFRIVGLIGKMQHKACRFVKRNVVRKIE